MSFPKGVVGVDNPGEARVSSATAQVLSTFELLERVIRSGELRPKDLVSCATVCRLWSEPSLDELWSDARFADLVRVFPSVKKVRSELQIEGAIARSHWDRFLHYSKRVVELDALWYDEEAPRIPDLLMLEFAVSRPALPLFPRMKELRWDGDNCFGPAFWISFGRILLTDSLTRIHIYLPSGSKGDSSMTTLLHAIPACSPNLSRLFVETQRKDHIYTRGAELRPSDFLSQLPNLSELHLPSGLAGPDTLRTISRLPSLNALSICFYLDQGVDFDAVFDSESFFLNLTSITIYRSRSSDIERFLSRISDKRNLEVLLAEFVDYTEPVLETLVRRTCGMFPALKKPTITQAIVDRPALENLSEDTAGELPSLSKSTLYHLRRHRRLESLSITYYKPSDATDDDFMGFVEALPNLTRLDFRFLPLTTGFPSLTLKLLLRLSNFYRINPILRGVSYLRLHVNASEWPDGSVDEFLLSEEVYPLRQLESICLEASPISSVGDVTLYLSQLIPSSCEWGVDTEDSWALPPVSEVENNQIIADELREMDSRIDKWWEVRNQLRGWHRVQSFLSKRRSCEAR